VVPLGTKHFKATSNNNDSVKKRGKEKRKGRREPGGEAAPA